MTAAGAFVLASLPSIGFSHASIPVGADREEPRNGNRSIRGFLASPRCKVTEVVTLGIHPIDRLRRDRFPALPRDRLHTDEHGGQEDGDGVLQEDEAFLEGSPRDGREHEGEEDPGGRPDLPLVQHGEALALDVLTELPDAVLDPPPPTVAVRGVGRLPRVLPAGHQDGRGRRTR